MRLVNFASNPKFNAISEVNATSSSFNFLEDEPDLYTLDDVKKLYTLNNDRDDLSMFHKKQ